MAVIGYQQDNIQLSNILHLMHATFAGTKEPDRQRKALDK